MYQQGMKNLSPSLARETRISFFLVWALTVSLRITTISSYASTELHPYTLSPSDTKSIKRCISTKRAKNSIIIRKSIETDLAQISDMLADECIGGAGDNNWFGNIKKLKARSSFQTQILHRLQATEAAIAVRSNLEYCNLASTANDRDICRLLWTEESFRSKLEKATESALKYEGTDTLWEKHNFNLQPSDPMMINHIMMTAVDINCSQEMKNCNDGRVAGFCEIAMLPIPSTENERRYSPCVANLVVSQNYRRKGIATRLLRNAERFVKLYWSETILCNLLYDEDEDEDEDDLRIKGVLGLYVDEGNEMATTLYLKEKFKISKHSSSLVGKHFLEKDICALRK